MPTIQYKTSLKCAGCVSSVEQGLNNIDEISSWNVDLNQPIKFLTIETENESAVTEKLNNLFKEKGFKLEKSEL
jgi:copper chaperone CopZ